MKRTLALLPLLLSGCASTTNFFGATAFWIKHPTEATSLFTAVGTGLGAMVHAHRECLLAHGVTYSRLEAGDAEVVFQAHLWFDENGGEITSFSPTSASPLSTTSKWPLQECVEEAKIIGTAYLRDVHGHLWSHPPVPALDRRITLDVEGTLYPHLKARFRDPESFFFVNGALKGNY